MDRIRSVAAVPRRSGVLRSAVFVVMFVVTSFVSAAAAWSAGAPAIAGATDRDAATAAGEAIYRRGMLSSGASLVAMRNDKPATQGAGAACVNCHRRSGLGAREGRTLIPPVTGRYLFRPRGKAGDDPYVPYVEGMRGDREPYTDATLARALREGLDSEGKPLNYLMPKYALDDSDMNALVSYLKRLDQPHVPGVTDKVLHFATIVTPDADPVKRRGMLAVIEQFFADRNSRQMATAPPMRTSSRTTLARSMFMAHRQWQLHVWELTGAESGWQDQLERHLAKEPVFAVVSGLGGRNWAPVHAFCERAALPCIFPNVEMPVENERDFYSLYFSRGVLLEAELIANSLVDIGGGKTVKNVQQVYRAGDSGEAGAQALAAVLKRHDITVSNQVVASGAPAEAVTEALRRASSTNALVLWLRPADIAALGNAPATPAVVYMSGLMGGLERAPLPSSWRDHTRLAYAFDLPDRRRVRVDFALGWFRIRKIPVEAVQVQADTYLALGLLSETLNHMVDTFVRDYLIERMEDMIERRIVTGYYPRLSLASGQRFASKGGYIVHFAEATGTRVVADGNWIVP